ncbi:IclR family transcriptional regulator [Aquabacterium sp.]|uniref:IclR family transcriptional regulator n=1 Tax=Aquabacterium sp. TaxID=1872578 RepID=UPI0037848FE1
MDYTVAAVDEAIKLLFAVAAEPGLGVTELSKRTGITKARAFRLLSTLEQRGLARRHGDNPVYRLGLQALRLGASAAAQLDVVREANLALQELGSALNEMVILRVRDGLESVCVARWESTQPLRVHDEIGHRRPLYAGASGKLLLAHAPQAVVDAVFEAPRERFTLQTPVSRTALQREIARVREQGYAVSAGEFAKDTTALAVPIFDDEGGIEAALSVSAPSSRMDERRQRACLSLMRSKAEEVSRRLGWRPGLAAAPAAAG